MISATASSDAVSVSIRIERVLTAKLKDGTGSERRDFGSRGLSSLTTQELTGLGILTTYRAPETPKPTNQA